MIMIEEEFTSYKCMFQVVDGGPVVVFDAMWPVGKWRQGFESIFSGVDWESSSSPIHFLELVGHTKDNKAYWLIGNYNEPSPKGSHTERIKDIITLGSPGENTVRDILKRHVRLNDKVSAIETTLTTTLGAAPSNLPNYDDFPVVMNI